MDRVSTLNLRFELIAPGLRSQARLAAAQTEMTTGRLADPGRTLGARTQGVSALRTLSADLAASRQANGLLGAQMGAMQDGLGAMAGLADTLTASMTTALGAGTGTAHRLAADGAASILAAAVSQANARLGDVHLFGGIRAGDLPLSDPAHDPAASEAVSNAFAATFGHPPDDPASAVIDAAAMAAFLDGFEAGFPATYAAVWAGDPPDARTARPLPGESVAVPVTHHDPGIRDLVLAASLGAALADAPVSEGARDAALERTIALAAGAHPRLSEAAGRLGTVQERVARADEAIDARLLVASRALEARVGVDPMEAAARVQSLVAQTEASLAVTARIGRLSLLNFL